MSKKLIVLAGISGSGKSSYAAKLVQEDPQKYALVNRDKIRELLFGFREDNINDYHRRPDLGKLEKQVTLYEDTLIHEGLNLGKTVIVDATHLRKEFLERFKFWNVPITYVYFDTPLNVAVDRDSKRTRQVGFEVIKKQWDSYSNLERVEDFEPITLENNSNKPPCIIFDIDNTLAHKGNRSAFDWKKVIEDSIDKAVAHTYLDLAEAESTHLIICTGRDGICLEETCKWLEDNGILYNDILIRGEGDMRPDYVVKEEMWRDITQEFHIVAMFDDRNQVVRRARALGLKVFQVEYGNF